MVIVNGNIFGEDGSFHKGSVFVEKGIITQIKYGQKNNSEIPAEDSIDAEDMYVIPGLVDIHLHGCGGYDFSDGTEEAFQEIARFQARSGVTSIVPATMTLPGEELVRIMEVAGKYLARENHIIKGITMEGPFISGKKKGAQKEENICCPNVAFFKRLQQTAGGYIKQVTIAPEYKEALAFIREVGKETVVSLAHTAATYEEAMEAFGAGVNHVTHLYNAMSPLGHREPGVIGAALDKKEVFVELICDGEHVHPAVVRATFRMFGAERICMISDSMRATGMPDGEYTLGGQPVWVKGNRAQLMDGNLAASVSTLYDCLRKVVLEMGIPLEEAVTACSSTPAKSLRMEEECGILAVGRRADLVVLDKNLERKLVIKNGKVIR